MHPDAFTIVDDPASHPVALELIRLGRNWRTQHHARAILRALEDCAEDGLGAEVVRSTPDGRICVVPPIWELRGGDYRYVLLVLVSAGTGTCLELIRGEPEEDWAALIRAAAATY